MVNKFIISLITSFLMFSCASFSQEASKFSNSSITDFTIYKVVPKKSPVAQEPGFNAELEDKNTPVKNVQEAEVKKKPVAVEIKKPAEKIIKTTLKAKPEIKPKAKPEVITKTKPIAVKKQAVKVTPPVVQKKPLVVEKTNAVKTEKKEPELTTEKEEKLKEDTDFNKDDYAKNLNNYLNNDSLTNNAVKIVDDENTNSFEYIVKPSMSLGIVIFLILVVAWIYSKIKGISPNIGLLNNFSDANLNKFKVLATSSLGQGKIIHLVEINGKQLVVGSTNNNINLLTEISPEEMDKLQSKAENPSPSSPIKKQPPSQEVESEHDDPEIYSAKYSELYKEYIEKKDKK